MECFWDSARSSVGLKRHSIFNLRKFFIFGCCCLLLNGFFLETVSAKELHESIDSSQDRSSLALSSPLKGFTKFNFFSRIPAPNKAVADKVHGIIEKELKSFGKVAKASIIVKTECGDAIDFSSLDGGAILVYQINNVVSLKGKELGVVRASLSLDGSVLIEKTKNESQVYIWSDNLFLKGSVDKNLENLVAESLEALLKRFTSSYAPVNTE